MLKLRTLGSVRVERDGTPLGGAAGQRRVLALLAILAVAGERGISRDALLGILWSESEPERARQALTQALYHARRALTCDELFLANGELRLNPAVIGSDVGDFERALDGEADEAALAAYGGAFLDGFFVTGAPEFERWASAQRSRLQDRYAAALQRLGHAAEEGGDPARAVGWWKRLAALDPLSTPTCVRLISALTAAGDRAAALQHARVHELLLRDELEMAPDPAFVQLVERVRSGEELPWTGGGGGGPQQRAGQMRDTNAPESPLVAADAVVEESIAVVDVHEGVPAAEPVERVVVPVVAPADARLEMAFDVARARAVRRWRAIAAVVVLAVLGLVVAGRLRGREEALPPLRDLIVVAPFRVAGAHPSLGYLKEGLVDLLATKLGGDPGSRAADPALVVGAWRRERPADTAGPTRAQAVELARRIGADRVLMGGVVGTPAKLVISASLVGVPAGEVRSEATVEGPIDSLTTLVDRLAARLVLGESSERDRLASHTTTSLDALRAFLHARSDYRHGRYLEAARQFDRAITLDPAFALAGLGLAQAAERLGARERRDRGLAVAWAARGDLAEADRLSLEALAGARYPNPTPTRERLAAWERVTAAAPDRASAWVELGQRLFHDGALLGARDARDRARAAFLRAYDLEPTLAPALQYLVQLAALESDTAGVRRWSAEYLAVDSTGDVAGFVRWQAAVALDDSVALREARRRLRATTPASARLVVLASLHGALDLADAERVLSAQLDRAVRSAERADLLRALHALATNRGRPDAARRVLDRLRDAAPRSQRAAAWRVLDALHGAGDSTAARQAVRELLTRAAPTDSARLLCATEQWGARGGAATARNERSISSSSTGQPDDTSAALAVCAALADAREAIRARRPDALRHVERLDSLAGSEPVASEVQAFIYLDIARMYAVLGYRDDALAAVRRRPFMSGWPPYLAEYLREEGRLAAAVGDTVGAARVYRHYLALRVAPEPSVQPVVDSVRDELDRLEAGRR